MGTAATVPKPDQPVAGAAPISRDIRTGARCAPARENQAMTDIDNIRIRQASPDDAETVRRLVGEIAAHQNQQDHVASTPERWREMLGRFDVTVLLAELDQQPVGYVSAVRRLHLWSGQDVIALDDLYVRAEARNLGVGKILMSELARKFQNRFTIAWGMQPDNHAAMRFYERLGATLYPKVLASWPPDRQPS
jgi:ribosomal protein S18 acetylase RimI-like enzyme